MSDERIPSDAWERAMSALKSAAKTMTEVAHTFEKDSAMERALLSAADRCRDAIVS